MISTWFLSIAFAPYAPSSSAKSTDFSLLLPKIVYILCNILTLSLGIWKCQSMGLLPTGTGDWLAFETRGSVCPSSFSIEKYLTKYS